MTRARKTSETPGEPSAESAPVQPEATPAVEADPPAPDPGAAPVAPPHPEPAAPPLGEQIAVALKTIHDEDAHRRQHDELAQATKQEPEKPKGLLDRLKWGA